MGSDPGLTPGIDDPRGRGSRERIIGRWLKTPHDLDRFVQAQRATFDAALSEIASGRKRSHWMWFIFPQLSGLGSSPTSEHFAIKSEAEARAYLAHPVLGPRLCRCAQALLSLGGPSAHEIFGYPDELKLRSSATLFASVSPPGSEFHQVLEQYFDGVPEQWTLRLLELDRTAR